MEPDGSSATQSPTTGSSARSDSRRRRLVIRLRCLAVRRQDVVLAAMLHRDPPGCEALSGVRLERGAPGVVPAERREGRARLDCPDARGARHVGERRVARAASIVGAENSKPASRRRAGSARRPSGAPLSHLAEERANREGRQRGDRRPPQRLAERVRELLARHRVRARRGSRPRRDRRRERRRTRPSVVERDPGPPLAPLPTRPPSPSLNGSSIRSSAPPSFARTMPWRKLTTRIPASRAGSAAASQARPTSARNPVPSADSSVRISSPRSP